MKKVLCLVLALSLVLGSVAVAFAGPGEHPPVTPADPAPTVYYYSGTKKATEDEGFVDVVEGAWYEEAVKFVNEKGYMYGVSETEFAPDANTSRAMMVTIVARVAGQETEGGENWYSLAAEWAVENEISDGENLEKDITREEFATMLYRYAQTKGQGFTGNWLFLLEANDAADISDWASEAMHWCVMKGILEGYPDGTLQPGATLTRAAAAAMVMRYCSL